MNNPRYPAKVLLFGEYSILLGGSGLSRPLHSFAAQWSCDDERRGELAHLIEPFCRLNLNASIHQRDVEQQLAGLLYFSSDIPIGKGLGSSGALTAALYDRFTNHSPLSRAEKFADLGLIEGTLFHERSSGFDALVSLEDVDFRLTGGLAKHVEIQDQNPLFIYLLDSQRTRSTGPLVAEFLELVTDAKFRIEMESLASLNDRLINAYCKGEDYWTLLDMLSKNQLAQMRFCIPADIADLWEEVLQKEDCRMKLCGAGGGGYYLLLSKKELKTSNNKFPIAECKFD